MNLTDWIGFAGVFILLFAFLLTITKQLSTNHIAYILMNFIGAGIACLASVLLNYWPFILLEGAWALVSLMGLINYLRKEN